MKSSNKLPELYKGEELRSLPYDDSYLVSNYGRVWSVRAGKWMGNHNGQLFDGYTKVYLTHTFVAEDGTTDRIRSNDLIKNLVHATFGAGHGTEYYMKALWRKYNENNN